MTTKTVSPPPPNPQPEPVFVPQESQYVVYRADPVTNTPEEDRSRDIVPVLNNRKFVGNLYNWQLFEEK